MNKKYKIGKTTFTFVELPLCFGNQDALKIPCSPKEVGGEGKRCEYQKECFEATFDGEIK